MVGNQPIGTPFVVTSSDSLSHPPKGGVPLAYVLRVRAFGPRNGDRFVIQVDDVQTAEVWRETSLESAFGRIRRAIAQTMDMQTGAPDQSGKPN